MRRERLDLVLRQIERRRLTLVVAAAGSGKSTALAQFAATTPMPVAWYDVDSLDGDIATFLAYLQRAVTRAVDVPADDVWTALEDALTWFDAATTRPLAIVLDNFHLVSGEPAEHAMDAIIQRLPGDVHVVIGSRARPGLDITRLQLVDDVLEIDADDLRFRTWEAERLVGQIYGLALPPDDIARLTRQVGGWAAGLQLFRLAARDKPPAEQRRLVRSASTRSPLARQYLAQNVLGALPDDLRDFLVHTSVLGVVSGELADDLLERDRSDDVLRRLEEHEVFVSRLDDDTYRYHEVLRVHLEDELAQLVDAERLEATYARAAELLEAAGHAGEAIRCHVRAGRDGDIGRLAASVPARAGAQWLDELADEAGTGDASGTPAAGGDPWIALALARRHLIAGRFDRARAEYLRAEREFGASAAASACRRERAELDGFTDPVGGTPSGWLGLLHRGLRTEPVPAARELDRIGTAAASVASGALRFTIGDLDGAARSFDDALTNADPPDWAIDAGRLGHQLIRLVLGRADTEAALTVIDRLAGGLDETWLGRIARAIISIASPSFDPADAAAVGRRCEADGDPWGAMFVYLCAGVATSGSPETAAGLFERAGALAEAYGSSLIASAAAAGLARVADPEAVAGHEAAAVRFAHRCGLRRPPIAVFVDLAAHRGALEVDRATSDPTGDQTGEPAGDPPPDTQPVALRCFGEFAIDGDHAELDELRPKARAVLMRLALDPGIAVHRDRLLADLWPDTAPDTARRNLQVAVSSIRRALSSADATVTVERLDQGYALHPPDSAACDLIVFRDLVHVLDDDARLTDRTPLTGRLLEICADELLPAAGAADWVVAERAHIRMVAARIARRAAAAALDDGDHATSIEFAERAVDLDRYDDAAWRLLIDAHTARGDPAAAEVSRRAYEAALAELGVSPEG